MVTGDAYPSGRLVPSPILGLANAPIVETKFLELAMSLLDFSPRIPLSTFSILLFNKFRIQVMIIRSIKLKIFHFMLDYFLSSIHLCERPYLF